MRYVLMLTAGVLVTAGLTRPEFAGRAAQLLVATTTLAVISSLAWSRWSDTPQRAARPFVPPEPSSTSGTETPDVTELVRAVESSDGRIPSVIAGHLSEACRGRLSDRHHLQVRSDADRAAIKTLVSPTMWSLISAGPDDPVTIPIRALPQLLDEVDTL